MIWTTQIADSIKRCKNKGYEFDERKVVNQAIVKKGLTGAAANMAYHCILEQCK
jgi:hypothetical protein